MTPSIPGCSDGPLWSVWMAAFHAPTLAVADELGLFAALRGYPATVDELATTLNIEVRATVAMASLMASLDFLAFAAGRYRLTDTARTYLLPESPYYWGGLLRRVRETPIDCRKLIDSLRRGRAAADARLTDMWNAPLPPPAALVAFTEAMHAHSFSLAMRILPGFPVAGTRRLLDVGGGSGSYSIAALLHHPQVSATVLDLPPVCEVAARYAGQYGVGARFATVAADMFRDPWPTDHDRILMSDVLHDWDDERCALLLRRAHDALPSGGRVWVHEMILDDVHAGPPAAAAYSMIMVFVTQGRQRSAPELESLLTAAGFADIQVTMTTGGFVLVEGTRR